MSENINIEKTAINNTIVVDGVEYTYYFTYNNNVENNALDVFFPGFAGNLSTSLNNSRQIIDYYNSPNTKSCGLVILRNDNGKQVTTIMPTVLNKALEDIDSKYNLTFNTVNMDGASYGEAYALQARVEYNLSSSERENKINFLSIYGGADNKRSDFNPILNMSEKDLKEGLKNTYVIMYGGSDTMLDIVKDYAKGVICIGRDTSNLSHDNVMGNISSMNPIDFMNGLGDLNPKTFNIEIYNPINGKYETIDYDQLKSIIPEAQLEEIIKNIELDSSSEESNFMKNIIDANKIKLSNLSPIIKCDNEFIKNNANNIINRIKSMNYLKTATKGYYSSTTEIPNIIIDKMYEIELTLENKLEILAKSFYNLAQASGEFEILDDKLSNEAGTLGTIGTTGGWYPSVSGGTVSGSISPGGITPSPTIPSPPTQEDKKPQPDIEKEPEKENTDNKNPEENRPNEDENKPNENKPQENENKEPENQKPEENKPNDEENKQEEKPEQNNSSSNSNNKKPSSNKTPSKKPSSSNKNDKENTEKPPIVEIPDTPIEPEESVIPEEPIIPQPELPDEIVTPQEPIQDIEDTSSPFKTIGILAGAGAAVGAGAYAAHKMIEKKKNEEDRENIYSDYEYSEDNDEIIEEETDSDQITPFDDNN